MTWASHFPSVSLGLSPLGWGCGTCLSELGGLTGGLRVISAAQNYFVNKVNKVYRAVNKVGSTSWLIMRLAGPGKARGAIWPSPRLSFAYRVSTCQRTGDHEGAITRMMDSWSLQPQLSAFFLSFSLPTPATPVEILRGSQVQSSFLGSQAPLRNHQRPWNLALVSTSLFIIPGGSCLPCCPFTDLELGATQRRSLPSPQGGGQAEQNGNVRRSQRCLQVA